MLKKASGKKCKKVAFNFTHDCVYVFAHQVREIGKPVIVTDKQTNYVKGYLYKKS